MAAIAKQKEDHGEEIKRYKAENQRLRNMLTEENKRMGGKSQALLDEKSKVKSLEKMLAQAMPLAERNAELGKTGPVAVIS
ncbi:hypothetical protein FOZ63_032456 [Perkinsus olseni]|uniref:Uncharacterized protein n=1 Tax=Perkinsus olseni TaxID=32597 RepID=A0A7J6NZ23_PEROL|nr:hypothetical protein FOZ63_032456 [Perkinsus olseni]